MRAASEGTHAKAQEFHNLVKAPLELGMICTIVGFLQELGRRLASFEVMPREAPCEGLEEELMSGALDVGWLARPPYRES